MFLSNPLGTKNNTHKKKNTIDPRPIKSETQLDTENYLSTPNQIANSDSLPITAVNQFLNFHSTHVVRSLSLSLSLSLFLYV